MKTILKIAWRNIWRTPLRSFTVIASIVTGIWAGIFVTALSYGLNDQRTKNNIDNYVSHIQIEHPKFSDNFESKYNLGTTDDLNSSLQNTEYISSYTFRTILYGMVNSASKSHGVKITGINPLTERNVTAIHKLIEEGDYFKSNKKNQILIGSSLAKKLHIKLRSKIVLTFQDAENNIVAGAFRVSGIFDTNFTSYDENNVFIHQKDIHRLFNEEQYHQAALLCTSIDNTDSVKQSLMVQKPNLSIKDWKDIAPELAYANEVMETYLLVIMLIIMLALLFGIVNTMLMAVFERRRELGMLLSIGMNKSKVFTLILVETFFLSLLGAPTGMLLGYLSIENMADKGLDLSVVAVGMESMGLSSVIYPSLENKFYAYISIMVFVFTLIAAIYPSRKALKLNPTEAIRTI